MSELVNLVKVDNLISRIESNESVLGSNEINKLYGTSCARVFKDEVKLVVPGNSDGKPILMQAPILTDERIKEIRSTRIKKNGSMRKACYLHLGFVPIAINSLLPSGNDCVKGRCALIDTSRSSYRNAVIDAFEFQWTKDAPYAAKLLTINQAIDIDCDVSIKSIQVVFEISGIDLDVMRSVAAITIGLSCVPTNDMFMLPKLRNQTPKISICNIISSIEEDDLAREAFEKMFTCTSIDVKESNKEEWLDQGKRWGFFGPKLHPVRRRNLTDANLLNVMQIRSAPLRLKRSGSVGSVTSTVSSAEGVGLGRSSLSLNATEFGKLVFNKRDFDPIEEDSSFEVPSGES